MTVNIAFHGGTQRSIDDLVGEVLDVGVSRVCVTGGEPLAQPNCERYCKDYAMRSLLSLSRHQVQWISLGLMSGYPIVLDLKTPGSGESSRNLLSNLALIQPKDQIKVVVTSEEDFRWFELFCDHNPAVFKAWVWFGFLHPTMRLICNSLRPHLVVETSIPYAASTA